MAAKAAGPRRLLAGSSGPERVPVRPDPRLADWHEPPHVRDVRSARERMAAQVEAGADVIVAPTWLTHRRALLPVGETRQARAWTEAAVQVAREAAELGLERRATSRTWPEPEREEPVGADPVAADRERIADLERAAADEERADQAAPGHDFAGAIPAPLRPRPLVAAALPALDADADSGGGRLLPAEAARERDYRDQAGLLADAEPDLLLVEGQTAAAGLRLALDAAGATGLPVWAALPAVASTPPDLDRMLDLLREAAVPMTLLEPPASRAPHPELWGPIVRSGLPWGVGLARPREDPGELVSPWLNAGARVIALLDGARATALAPLRQAIDAHERAMLLDRRRAHERWWRIVGQAAQMAPGGMALWVGEAPDHADQGLPKGFEWLVLDPDEAERLPAERFRLVVDDSADTGSIRRAARLLERGGIAALLLAVGGQGHPEMRFVVLDEAAQPALGILRREA